MWIRDDANCPMRICPAFSKVSLQWFWTKPAPKGTFEFSRQNWSRAEWKHGGRMNWNENTIPAAQFLMWNYAAFGIGTINNIIIPFVSLFVGVKKVLSKRALFFIRLCFFSGCEWDECLGGSGSDSVGKGIRPKGNGPWRRNHCRGNIMALLAGCYST